LHLHYHWLLHLYLKCHYNQRFSLIDQSQHTLAHHTHLKECSKASSQHILSHLHANMRDLLPIQSQISLLCLQGVSCLIQSSSRGLLQRNIQRLSINDCESRTN
jgi:hypothetical protein